MDDELIENLYTCALSGSSAALVKTALSQRTRSTSSKWNELLRTQRLPVDGWSDASIEGFLLEMSAMDSNNFDGAVGMGEREGRLSNFLIKRRHFG